jgi:histone H3/H4
MDALIVMQVRNIGEAQKGSSVGAFAAGPFDALLVGACGVQAWSAPLVRLLSADARKVVESFLRPRITERAATVLRVAAEKFLAGVFHSALMVAIMRHDTCVWACDVEDAIKVCGLDRVAGSGRPRAGCACDGLVSATASTPQRAPPDVTDSDEARTAPAVVWRRRPMTWCEAAPLDGSSAQSAIRRSMRWVSLRLGVPHLAPGALNTAGSALCAFLSTVVAKARSAEHPLLREAAESDSRVDRLVTLVHTSCAAPLSSDDESESESDESESEADSDRTDIRYAWEHTLRTRWTEAPGHDGLTESVVLRALEALDYKVYGGNPTLSELARMYHERFGQARGSADVLGLMRGGILNMDRVLSELDDERRDVVDDRAFELRLTRSMEEPPDAVPEPCCGAVGCSCPCCGRECLLWLVKYLSSPNDPNPYFSTSVTSLEPVVDMDAVRVAQTRAGKRWTGCVYFDRDPHVAPPKLWTVLPARRRPLRQGMDGGAIAARTNRMLTEAAARRAGFTHWAPEVEGLVGDLVKAWGTEIAVLARAYQLHEAHRESRTIEYGPHTYQVQVAALSGPLTFSSVARAVVTLLEKTQRRSPVCYVRPFAAASDARTALRAAFPYAEPLLGPNEMGAGIELDDDQVANSTTAVTFDTEANELMSRVFAHRLAWMFHRGRRVSPQFDLPGGGHGPVLVPDVLFFMDSCSGFDSWCHQNITKAYSHET